MSAVKKSTAGGGAPSLDILAAKLKILEAAFSAEPYEVKMDSGHSFTAGMGFARELLLYRVLGRSSQ